MISGRNGSGKSAVLQAMQAALGSKAKDTGRGDNFRELVRTGCHEARVKVSFCAGFFLEVFSYKWILSPLGGTLSYGYGAAWCRV